MPKPLVVCLAVLAARSCVLVKAEASPSGEIRGRRHTMLDDTTFTHPPCPRPRGALLAGVNRRHHALCLRRREHQTAAEGRRDHGRISLGSAKALMQQP